MSFAVGDSLFTTLNRLFKYLFLKSFEIQVRKILWVCFCYWMFTKMMKNIAFYIKLIKQPAIDTSLQLTSKAIHSIDLT